MLLLLAEVCSLVLFPLAWKRWGLHVAQHSRSAHMPPSYGVRDTGGCRWGQELAPSPHGHPLGAPSWGLPRVLNLVLSQVMPGPHTWGGHIVHVPAG